MASQPEETLELDDPLCRDLRTKRHGTRSQLTQEWVCAPEAFLPAPNSTTKRLELSVFEVRGLSDDEVEAFRIETCETQKLFGWVILTVGDFREQNLEDKFDNQPPRHVDIIGWPTGDNKLKSVAGNLLIAQRLQARSRLYFPKGERTAKNPKFGQ